MVGRILFPPEHQDVTGPLIFLAGPIQGSVEWQTEAVRLVHARRPDVVIANPRRDYMDGTFIYDAQVDWETAHLRRAAQEGVVLFWLAKERLHDCGRAYAQTTRFELAEWVARVQHGQANIVIGIEDGFTGARYIRRRISQDCPDMAIFSSLEETCDQALSLV
jgi:hypothetical protein